MSSHFSIIGIIYLIFGVLGVLAGAGLAVLFFGAGAVASADSGEAGPVAALGMLGAVVAGGAVITSLPSILAGWLIIKRSDIGKIIGIVLAVLSLTGFPVGTIFGVYVLWAFLSEEGSRAWRYDAGA